MLTSMTAFARVGSQSDCGNVVWELRTINHRYLDITIKTPELFRAQESLLRDKVKTIIKRGKLECFLKFHPVNVSNNKLIINNALVTNIGAALHQIETLIPNCTPTSSLDILRWPEVLQIYEQEQPELAKVVIELFEQALMQLQENRLREGQQLTIFLKERMQNLQIMLHKISQRLPQNWQITKEKYLRRIEELTTQFDHQRLEHELAIMAQRIDVSEEIERINAHCKEFEHCLSRADSQGRALDFLMQELNRETNTLGAKCNESEINQLTVEMKITIDQMREQIQNIE